MGIAFENIPCGAGYAYFPGISLAYKEIAYCNFGLRPLKYPVPGYQALQVGYLFDFIIYAYFLKSNQSNLHPSTFTERMRIQ